MNSFRFIITICFFVTLSILCYDSTWAARLGAHPQHNKATKESMRGLFMDKRHRHNQLYPPKGHSVRHVPSRHHKIVHRGSRFYFSSGLWYRPLGTTFTVIAPPVGIITPVLPRNYTTIWFSGTPYYYAAETYYRWSPGDQGYIVTEPPDNSSPQSDDMESHGDLFVYPRAGQGEELQALDRFECHSWAVEETGFDPTRPGGNVPANVHYQKRTDYNRATKACLEARDYSVE